MLRPSLSAALSLVLGLAALAACGGGGDDDGAGNTAGAAGSGAGQAGTSAQGGAGGSGKGGSAGGAGTAGVAGTGGAAGKSGSSGTSGTGGATGGGAGAGGASGTAGTAGSGGMLPNCGDPTPLAPSMDPPKLLSQTGLYAAGVAGPLRNGVRTYTPTFPLWSDAAKKTRYAYVPGCSKVDTTDMDHWDFPEGTRFWKEFVVDGKRIEMRFIHKFGPTSDDFYMVTYQFRADGSEADLIETKAGVPNAQGTQHDIPSREQCKQCHNFLPEKILGFSAFQLTGTGPGVTLKALSDEGRLTVPAPDGFTPPGDATTKAALGYLHANCGNCHNETGSSPTPLRMRLLVGQKTPEATDLYTTGINKAPINFMAPGVTAYVVPGDEAASAVLYRMSHRNDVASPNVQMPPLGTEVVDDAGVAAVSAWLKALPK